MICKLCAGLGCIQDGVREWWTCQACGGGGTRIVFGPTTIRVHKIKTTKPPKGKQK